MDQATSTAQNAQGKGLAELLPLLAGALMGPLAPVSPIATAVSACAFGLAFGYVRQRIRPRAVLVIYAVIAIQASVLAASAVAVRSPYWSPWASWLALFAGLTAGWLEREGAPAKGRKK